MQKAALNGFSMAFKTFAALVALLPFFGSPLQAERLFVLHDDQSVASVLDPVTLEPLGSAPAPDGVFRVLGLPDDAGSGFSARFYLVGARSIVVTDGDYHEIDRIDLPVSAIQAPHGAALSADGSRLLVATRFGVLTIDTVDGRIVERLIPGFPVGGVALLPDPDRAWVFADGAALARSIEIDNDRLGDEAALLPAALSGASLSPLGLHAYGLAGAGVYDLSTLQAARFTGATDPIFTTAADSSSSAARLAVYDSSSKRAPIPGSGQQHRFAVTDSGRFFMISGGRLLRGAVDGKSDALVVRDPTSGGPLNPADLAWTASPDGSTLYTAAFGGDQLLVFDPSSLESARSVDLSAAPTGVELVIPRVRQAGMLELVTLNNSTAAGGTDFQITVRATNGSGAPDRDIPIFTSNIFPADPMLTCLSALTDSNGEGTLECSLGAVDTPQTIQVTISDAAGRSAPIFSLQAVPPTAAEGLFKLEGDDQDVPSDSDFTFVAQLSSNRLPVEGAVLSVTTDPIDPDIFTCLLQAQTDADGKATISCTAKEVVTREKVSVTVTHIASNDSVVFTATIDPAVNEPTRLIKFAGDEQTVVQGSFFTVTLQVTDLAGFSPIINVIVQNLSQSVPPAITCPTNAAIDDDGFATIRCQAGPIQGQIATGEIQISHFGETLPDPFRIIIVASGGGSGGVVQTMELLSDEEFPAEPGVPVIDGVQVRAVRSDGKPAPEVPVYFSSPGDVVFDPPVVDTDAEGIASTTVTVGCNPAGDPSIFIGFNPGEQFLDVEADIQPGKFSQIVKIRGDNQSGAPGQELNANALVGQTQDQCGNVVEMQEVSWKVRPSFAATFRNVVNISDDRGRVSVLVRLGQFGGPFQVEVGNEVASARFDLAVNLPAQELRIRSGDDQNALAGQALAQPLVVQVVGITGFGVGGVPVEWSASGAAQVVGSSSVTDTAGVSYARIRVGTGSNPQQGSGGPQGQVQATAAGKTVTFFVNGSPKPIAPVEAFVNGASFLGGWTPGSAGSIFGQVLAPDLTVATQTPFPTNLAGVSVTINGTPAPLIFVAPGQINLQVPFETAAGPATVIVDNNGQSTTVQGVPINAVQPGIFIDPNTGRAAALKEDFSVITAQNPAVPGEVVQLFFTGGGPLTESVATNQPGPGSPLAFTSNSVVVGVDGEGQQTLAAVYAPQLITAYQVNFVLGENTASGDRDLSIVINGAGSQTVKLPVQ